MDLTTDPIKLSMAHLNKIIRRVQMVQDFKVSQNCDLLNHEYNFWSEFPVGSLKYREWRFLPYWHFFPLLGGGGSSFFFPQHTLQQNHILFYGWTLSRKHRIVHESVSLYSTTIQKASSPATVQALLLSFLFESLINCSIYFWKLVFYVSIYV